MKRKYSMKTIFQQCLLLLLLFLITGCGNFDPVYKKDINKDYLQLLHNKERGSRDIDQLQLDDELAEYAQKHAEWMAQKGRLVHSSLKGLKYRSCGENIAWNQQDEDEVVKSWMSSSGHKRNILNSGYTHVGFGAAINSKNQIYWCAVFGG